MEGTYYLSKEGVEDYVNMAKEVNSEQLIEKLKEHLAAQSMLLELGSGPGTDWRILSQTFTAVGSDYSMEFVKYLKRNNPAGTFLHLDAITLDTFLRFDGVYANKVMQHLTDEEIKKSLEKHSGILNKEGIICHSYWKGEGDEIFKGLFVNYQNEEKLQELYEEHFEILKIEVYKEFEEDDSIVILAKKKQ
ncbi:trans-aconitate 2-methyltransferase [Flammeovirga sp. EKP202]|uniref:class I SAM-dependent methyltransferase n=1 Tax=Flammeovirga sp. EKP202 TaxID=2770592 RepID=UPI00165EC61B|nr:class I SAM-dependent methyltransferase [Flammeovirga sp. EKP202]MBD0400760.1 class I SAM-dependent methyltransferase [Flammeovirga sp. EKP202]